MLCLVRPAAEEYEVVRRKDSYRRTKNRPSPGVGTRASNLSLRLSPAGDGRSAR